MTKESQHTAAAKEVGVATLQQHTETKATYTATTWGKKQALQ